MVTHITFYGSVRLSGKPFDHQWIVENLNSPIRNIYFCLRMVKLLLIVELKRISENTSCNRTANCVIIIIINIALQFLFTLLLLPVSL